MRIIDGLTSSQDVKNLNIAQQKQLAEEIREKITAVVNQNGGHLSSNLGIVETTIALYHAFDFPKDKIIFDVGHQCYAHKLLSGRKEEFVTLRQDGGISGFPDAEESEYDVFTSGHAGSSISQGLGLCSARDKLGEDYYVICVVGDGSLGNGLNLEALMSSNSKPKKFIVILNDNGMSISKNTNGFYKFISKKTIGKGYVKGKNTFKKIFRNSFVTRFFRKVKGFIKRILVGTNYFEDYGFKYVGVPDGNNIKELNKFLAKVKTVANNEAVFLHLSTVKGKGNLKAEENADIYHGVGKKVGASDGGVCKPFSAFVPEIINELIEKDDKIITITAGMKDGTGLKQVEKAHPKNFLDVGILEEYAVTLSAGMAKGGLKPIIFLYSTFLQRAYDQILQDISLQNLPVIFCVDRAGLVGEDGKTHQGVFDISFLSHMPNVKIFTVCDSEEFKQALTLALDINSPVVIRYSKETGFVSKAPYNNGEWVKVELDNNAEEGAKKQSNAVILALGSRMVKLANSARKEYDKEVEVYSVRRIKPLDEKLLSSLSGKRVITLEENCVIGGFGSLVNAFFAGDKNTAVYNFGTKDKFIAHGSVNYQLERCGLTKEKLLKTLQDIEV